jgi:hypothetical protein
MAVTSNPEVAAQIRAWLANAEECRQQGNVDGAKRAEKQAAALGYVAPAPSVKAPKAWQPPKGRPPQGRRAPTRSTTD